MEDEIRDLKTQRKMLKSKITYNSNKLQGIIQQHSSEVEVQSAYANLQDLYEQFCTIHLDYSELVLSDTSYEAYKVVGGLDLDQYEASVKDTYCQASTACGAFKQSLFEAKVSLSIISAKRSIDSLSEVTTDDSNFQTILSLAQGVLQSCKDLFLCTYTSSLDTNLGDIISELEFQIAQTECKVRLPRSRPSNVAFSGTHGDAASASSAEGRVGPLAPGHSPVSTGHMVGPADSARGGGLVCGSSAGGGLGSEINDMSIVSVYNNNTRYNIQPIGSSTVLHSNPSIGFTS